MNGNTPKGKSIPSCERPWSRCPCSRLDDARPQWVEPQTVSYVRGQETFVFVFETTQARRLRLYDALEDCHRRGMFTDQDIQVVLTYLGSLA